MSRANLPAAPSHGSMGEVVQTGLTIREHFAALAMQGYLASPALCDQSTPWTAVAKWSVEMADCLIAELAKVQS